MVMAKESKGLTYEELMALALEHYNEGGDQTYECCDERWFDEMVKMSGPITKKDALEMFRIDKEIYDDIAATAW